MEDAGLGHHHNGRANGYAPVEPAAITAITTEVTRQDLAVIEFLNKVDRLYRELLELRDRELAAKDRLITELERRAQAAEEHESALRDYIRDLPDERFADSGSDDAPTEERRWWHVWR